METLKRLERRCRLRLTDAERALALDAMSRQESAFESLGDVRVDDVEPMIYVNPIENALRADVAKREFSRERLQRGAKNIDHGYWFVPKVVD